MNESGPKIAPKDPVEIEPGLWLVPHNLELDGFSDFLCSYLILGKKNILIEVGPSASTPNLLQAIKKIGVESIDLILLTHIHLDHAGGLYNILKEFSHTKVIAHKKGIPHLVSPKRLWNASLKVLGHIAEGFGEPMPIPEEVFIKDPGDIVEGIRIIDTPGHAPHHYSYVINNNLFVGEAVGVFLPFLIENYTRPATPPRFFLEEAKKSLETLRNIDAKLILYAHMGWHNDSKKMINNYSKQLDLWWKTTEKIAREENSEEENINAIINELEKVDPVIAHWQNLRTSERDRETYFIKNSLKGFIGYWKSKKEKKSGI